MSHPKSRKSAASDLERREARRRYLEAAPIGLPAQAPAPSLPPNACCPKAYVVECYCGGARQCPLHGGPVCFGKYSHD
jgi:hypothetical protein